MDNTLLNLSSWAFTKLGKINTVLITAKTRLFANKRKEFGTFDMFCFTHADRVWYGNATIYNL